MNKGTVKIKIQKKNAKKNAKKYKFKTINEMYKFLNENNVDKFLNEFCLGVKTNIALIDLAKAISPSDPFDIEYMMWIDD